MSILNELTVSQGIIYCLSYECNSRARDEQADEHTRLRKNLEQSNKNCRILSFKLRKVERKAEELENERSALEKKYEEVKIYKKFIKNKNLYIIIIK